MASRIRKGQRLAQSTHPHTGGLMAVRAKRGVANLLGTALEDESTHGSVLVDTGRGQVWIPTENYVVPPKATLESDIKAVVEGRMNLSRQKLFEEAKAEQAAIEEEVDAASAALQVFPRGPMGLTPDAVRSTSAYQDAKMRFDRAFAKQRAFNALFTKRFSSELRAERSERMRRLYVR